MIDPARLRILEYDLARIADELASFRGEREPGEQSSLPANDIRRVIRSRRMRERMFPERLFADPAWDMLLELAAHHLEGSDVSITGLCDASAVAQTTGLRWIALLEAQGMVEREPDFLDRRRINVRLSERGLHAMTAYVAASQEADLPIA